MTHGRLARGPLLLLLVGFTLGAFSLTFTHLAGSFGGPGFEDGAANSARFKSDAAVAVDASGNVYVADTGNHTIRVISTGGEVTTLAGLAETTGTEVGRGAHARFNSPAGITVASTGAIYVADSGNHAIRKLAANGVTSAFVGYPGLQGFVNGSGFSARFRNPRGLTTDNAGNIYVADTGNHAIRKITSGGVVSTLAGTGSSGNVNDVGTLASFSFPNAVVFDAISNALYVADSGNRVIRRITLPGAVVTTFAGTMGTPGHGDGMPGFFFTPSGITVDSAGTFYVSDSFDHSIRSITSGGTVGTTAGFPTYPGPEDGALANSRFRNPSGIAALGTSTLFVADSGNHTVRKVLLSGTVSTFAGLANASGTTNANGSAARFNSPGGMASYPGPGPAASFSYVSDTGNNAIRRVFLDGDVEFVAGGSSGFNDGLGAAAQFRGPQGMALRFSDLSVFVADTGNHCIRLVDFAGNVSRFAGQAFSSGNLNGDRLTTARFNSPRAVALNQAENTLFVADTGNFLVRKVNLSTGAVSTLAGSGSFGSTNANGTSASFGVLTGISVDASDNVYVAESQTGTIRKIEPDGDVTTFAGTPFLCCGGVDGTGAAARFGYPGPTDIASFGYVADPQAHLIRTIDFSTAAVGTAGGRNLVNGTSDGTGTFARFNAASRIANAAGGIVIAEGHTIRYGGPEIADRAVIDSAAGLVGNVRQLDTSPQTATSWEWTIIRRPVGSVATLSSTTIRNPTFTPDVPDMYVFRCKATSASGSSISTVVLNGNDPATTFTVGYPGPVPAGTSVAFAVVARDPWGNVADGYTGTVHFTSSDDTAVLPADYTFTPSDHGAHPAIITMKRSGFQTITVKDTVSGISGTGGFFVSAAAATHLSLSMPSPVGSGNAATITVTAKDQFENTADSYTGTIHFTSTDGAATLPSNYTFVPADQGTHTFTLGVTLRTGGAQNVTATDVSTPSINGTIGVIVGPPIPTSFTANRSGANIFLAWNPSSGADHYLIHRASPTSGGFTFLTSTADTTFLDTTALANTVYVYEVRAVDASANMSPFSTPDAATTIVFTDDPLVTGSTLIKAVHITQLRTAINSLRACAGLTATTFTDPSLGVGTTVKKVHIDELRTGMAAARSALGLPAISFTDPTIVVNMTLVRKLHIADLRTGVK